MHDDVSGRAATPSGAPSRLVATPRLPPSGCEVLACARCTQPVVASSAVVRERERCTLRQAVYAYEIDVLGQPTWCYSTTSEDGNRYDIIRAMEVSSGGATGGCLRLFSGGSLGVMIMDKAKCPEGNHSWFPNYAWQAVRCGGCRQGFNHLGWIFTPKEGSLPGFFGLILTRLREITPRFTPRLFPESSADSEHIALRRQREFRGLSASAVQTAGSNEASAAVRGFGTMPSQFLPCTDAASRNPLADVPCSARRSPRPAAARRCPRPLQPPLPERLAVVEVACDSDKSDSSAESADFQEQRFAQRHSSCELAAKRRAQTLSRLGGPRRPVRQAHGGDVKVLPRLEAPGSRSRAEARKAAPAAAESRCGRCGASSTNCRCRRP